DYKDLHNHSGNGFIYTYPKIQYKIIGGDAVLIGIKEGISILGNIVLNIRELNLKGSIYKVINGYAKMKFEEFGVAKEMIKYKFISPWIALNERNYIKYKELDEDGKRELLEKILIGNVLSMSKYLDYTVEERLKAEILEFEDFVVKYKGNKFIGFRGEFLINFNIPNYLGIGRKVSKGFGSVVLVDS
ncbi:CRISPR-associated endonuclease Cas6, partial [Methanocaldococcus sp.]